MNTLKVKLFILVGVLFTGAMCYFVANTVHFFFSANPYHASFTLIAMAVPLALYWAGGVIYFTKHSDTTRREHTGTYKQ